LGWNDRFSACEEGFHQVIYDPEGGETVCSKCGLVLKERQIETDFNFCAPSRKHIIAFKSRDHSLRRLNLHGIKRYLDNSLVEINAPLLVQEKAAEICKSMRKLGGARGYSTPIVAKALLYTAHRLCRAPISLSEIALSVKEKEKVARCYRKLCTKLKLKVPKLQYTDYLVHLSRKKKIDKEVEILASEILRKAYENRLPKGANPVGTVATALYIASIMAGQRITQKELAQAVGISEVTIRANYRILQNF